MQSRARAEVQFTSAAVVGVGAAFGVVDVGVVVVVVVVGLTVTNDVGGNVGPAGHLPPGIFLQDPPTLQ